MAEINKELEYIVKTFCHLYKWHFGENCSVRDDAAKKIEKRLLPMYTVNDILKRLYRAFVNNYWEGVPKSISEFINKFHVYVVTEPETAVVGLPPITIKFKRLLNTYYQSCEIMNIIPEIITKEIAIELWSLMQYNPLERIDKLITVGVTVYGYPLNAIIQNIEAIKIEAADNPEWKTVLEQACSTRDAQRFIRSKRKQWTGEEDQEEQ